MPAKARATAVARKPAARKPVASASTTRRTKASGTATKRAQITVEDLADFNESINVLVHGDSGVGKTPFVGAAPDAVFISTEKGSISAKRFGSKAKLIRATSWEKLEAAVEYLEENPTEFKWAIVDSVTKMQQLLLRHLLQINVNENRKAADIDVPQVQDHQKWQNMFKRFIDRLIDCEVNVIFVATSMHKEDEEGDPLVLPDIQGKDYAIAQYVCAQMDGVYCLKARTNKKSNEPEWFLLTKFKPPFFAKDRYDAFGELGGAIVKLPNMAEIIEAIENSGEAAVPNKNVIKRRALAAAKDDDDIDEDDIDEDDDIEEDEDLDEDDVDDDDDDVDDDDDDDVEDDEEDDDDEPEPPAKATRRKPVAATRRAKPATRKPAAKKAEAEPDDDEDDEEDAKPVTRRRTPRKAAAVRKPAAARKPAARKAKPADDDDDFDVDDEDVDDFDDDED